MLFESSDRLAGAYGIAVSMLMAITTLLAALIARRWGYNLAAVAAVNGYYLAIDLLFLAANSVKVVEGGWFPLVLTALVATLMLTWRKGTMLLEAARVNLRMRLDSDIHADHRGIPVTHQSGPRRRQADLGSTGQARRFRGFPVLAQQVR
jgi:KUP system potassium uptake protein